MGRDSTWTTELPPARRLKADSELMDGRRGMDNYPLSIALRSRVMFFLEGMEGLCESNLVEILCESL